MAFQPHMYDNYADLISFRLRNKTNRAWRSLPPYLPHNFHASIARLKAFSIARTPLRADLPRPLLTPAAARAVNDQTTYNKE